uniref:Uncharacterized protein n=1 Tax=Candidatus Kentrum sp. TUN TaxID=2126343 RepID=A0A450ZLW4_9GAMM|nr:MAG: hypothetical protein BECKTUN1418F_GA0071002_10225 [Candidatus Kentron sp. TUN]VFK54813.1 MAG: hypothetical protein BECKTUN1418E_GA0071001_10235 [Candidatus Kentron sp. TUN]
MQKIIIEIRIIEDYYVQAHYPEAYEALHELCRNNRHCEEFSQGAMSILSRYNDIESATISGTKSLSEQDLSKRAIGAAFGTLIGQMKRCFNPQQSGPTYEGHARHMKEHRDMLRKTLMTLEEDDQVFSNPKKTALLSTIKEQLAKVIKYLRELSHNFRMVADL